MPQGVFQALDFADGPLLRAAIGLFILGIIRAAMLQLSDTIGGYLSLQDKGEFWRKLRLRALWVVFPGIVLLRTKLAQSQENRHPAPRAGTGLFAYHLALDGLSLILRLGSIIVPTLMIAHVHLLNRALGVRWPTLPGDATDILAVITIVAGFLLFLGRLYSPRIRRIEPAWSFFKPLILIAPFLTGFLAMHPHWSPLDWHFVMLLHVLSASVVLVLVPFGGLLAGVLTRLTDVAPEAEWPAGAATFTSRTDARHECRGSGGGGADGSGSGGRASRRAGSAGASPSRSLAARTGRRSGLCPPGPTQTPNTAS